MARLRPPSANWRRDALHTDIGTPSSAIECRRSVEMVESNPFAFSPGQLSEMFGPKDVSAFHALGGLRGIEAGLQTHRNSGLSIDENNFGRSSFEEAPNLPFSESPADDPNQPNEPSCYGNAAYFHYATLADRKRIFTDNRLPKMSKSLLELILAAKSDIVLHYLFELISLFSIVGAVVRAFTCGLEIKDDNIARKSLQALALMEHLFMSLLLLAVPWTTWKMWLEYSRIALLNQRQDRPTKVIRSSITTEISKFDLMPGDIVHIEPGDVIPADGIFIGGHNVVCDESMCGGRQFARKQAGDDAFAALDAGRRLEHINPIILSGSKVLEGIGTFLVIATGVHSVDGKTRMMLMDKPKVIQQAWSISLIVEGFCCACFHPRLFFALYFQGFLNMVCGTFWQKLKAASNACLPHTATRNDKRSFLPILLEGESAMALPDTEVGYNVITEDYAALIGASINRDPSKQRMFTNAVGRKFRSSGITELSIALLQNPGETLQSTFTVFRQCAEPLVLGNSFLKDNKIFTKVGYSHNLIKATSSSMSFNSKGMLRLMHMETPRQKLTCTMDSRLALANADTGSDLDLVSLRYARSRRWKIRKVQRQEQSRVMLANQEVAHLSGYVEVMFSVKGVETWKRFHVLKGLVCDIILGDATLESIDAFKKCEDSFVSVGGRNRSFCMIRWVERLNQVERDVDKIMERHNHGNGVLQKTSRWSRLVSMFFPGTGDSPKADVKGITHQLRDRLNEIDSIEFDNRKHIVKKNTSLSDKELAKEQEIDRSRRDKHDALRRKILKHIQDLSVLDIGPRSPPNP